MPQSTDGSSVPSARHNTPLNEKEEDINNPFRVPTQRHPTLYIPSGDIILSSEREDMINLVRVHRATLSYHSPAFQDLFALPPTSVNETYDGVPVVEMQDSFEELAAFLEVLYGHQTAHTKRYHPDAALAATGALKLIAKYEVDHLRDRLIRHIEADWPKSPTEWIIMYRIRQTYTDVNQFHGELGKNVPLENSFPEPASAIRLARECGIPSILPAAFLELVGIDRGKDWDDLREDDDNLSFDTRSARWSLLSILDSQRLEVGKKKLVEYCADLRGPVLTVPADICRGDFLDCQAELTFRKRQPGHSGGAGKEQNSFLLGRTAVREEWPQQPSERLNPMIILQAMDDTLRDWDLCTECCKRVRQNIAHKMQECWAELPDLFNLGDGICSEF
ncbi:hypothetical protein PHLGIDRAFT_486230 [Phlebiopsis gigantea 11061_1 CR5-6]|uniref:BTB domain-containing protein n=1 Tax=Phlebiopsis gigantea (strain 11061_1 CR5-6) TaxID=745531 RepID=A0A0C3PII1_PHLG1|nr:hypothetical protein PHLGIDRAFT_486230 [Phlebiopsis gigantea 11061_1 CR5-6]